MQRVRNVATCIGRWHSVYSANDCALNSTGTPMHLHFLRLSLLLFSLTLLNCRGVPSTQLPGKAADGRVRLPNGWFLSPAGTHVPVDELPLNIAVTPDERYIVVTNNGTAKQSLSVVETSSWTVVQTVPVAKSWLGIGFIEGGKRLLVSGGNDNRIDIFRFDGGRASLIDSMVIGKPWPTEKIWIAGLEADEKMGLVFAAGKQSDSLYVLDLHRKNVLKRIALAAKPYTCLNSSTEPLVYVSLWGGSAIALVDKATLRVTGTIPVGDHPTEMLESADGKRLFVANANANTVSVIDVSRKSVIETISTALTPQAPEGSTPNSLATSGDGMLLYVANADNNAVAVIDISHPGESRPLGFIPVGWYPTCVRVLSHSDQIIVANGRGMGSRPNPGGPNPTVRGENAEYIGWLFHGTISCIDRPSPDLLAKYTAEVYANSPYSEQRKTHPGPGGENSIPQAAGGSSPIKHVFYVIKENRTYDQVFGDMKSGNGDEALCLFPESVTPNHHALAHEFVLLDNFYADATVSADGHNWSMGAYATDYVQKSWPTSYGDRGGDYEYEGGYPAVYPSAGYLWDNCRRNGVSYRTYGEFAINGKTPADTCSATMESLRGHVAPHYRGWDLDYSDVDRVREWSRELDRYEKDGGLPQFQIIKLPNDHTEGTHRGSLTPRAYLAQNDLALGMIVNRLSHSPYWKESAVFVVEDDAQNGPDHVDAHRTVALVISPYTKRHFVDSDMYSTCSMVRTMELILGLPPLSQFDAAATPMYNSFTQTPDLTPYTVRPTQVDLNERNAPGSIGQARSGEMDFTREDGAPEQELNEIVWKAVRGSRSEMPPPVRSAFARGRPDEPSGD